MPEEAGATHSGIFFAWALFAGLGGEPHVADTLEAIERRQRREVTPGLFFLEQCDGKLTDEDFNDEGNAFAQAYFDFTNGTYLDDYHTALGADLPSLYHVADSWESFDTMAAVLDQRLFEWRKARS